MQSKKLGKSTTKKVEILNISEHGIWLFVDKREFFLSFADFPWFKNAPVGDIHQVKFFHGHHLHWPTLDIDLELDSLINPEKYPLVFNTRLK